MIRIYSWLIIIILLLTAGCGAARENKIVDRSGRTAVIKVPINRIVSTAPSNTEIITDLGQAHKLVAIDRHSANVSGIPGGLPLLDFFYPDAELIINLEPDIIIASGHNPTGTGDDPFRLLREAGIAVVYISLALLMIVNLVVQYQPIYDIIESSRFSRGLYDNNLFLNYVLKRMKL